MIKDHIIAQVVNDLRDTAVKFHDTQQLRERLRHCIEPLLTAPAPQVAADERAAFDIWWAGFADTHEEWPYADSGALRWAAYQAGRAAAPAAQGDALKPAQIEDGYEGGTCIADPTRLGGTVHLHYISPEHAESAFEVIAEIIDAAIAAKAANK